MRLNVFPSEFLYNAPDSKNGMVPWIN